MTKGLGTEPDGGDGLLVLDEVFGEQERITLQDQLAELLVAVLELAPFLERGLLRAEIPDEQLPTWLTETLRENETAFQDIATAIGLSEEGEYGPHQSQADLPVATEHSPEIARAIAAYQKIQAANQKFRATLRQTIERRLPGKTGRTNLLDTTRNTIISLLQAIRLSEEGTLQTNRTELLEAALRSLRGNKPLIADTARKRFKRDRAGASDLTTPRLRAITGKKRAAHIDPAAVSAKITPAHREELLAMCRQLMGATIETYPFLREILHQQDASLEAALLSALKSQSTIKNIRKKRTAADERQRRGEEVTEGGPGRIRELQEAFDLRMQAILEPEFTVTAPNDLRDLETAIRQIPVFLELAVQYGEQNEGLCATIAAGLAKKLTMIHQALPGLQHE